MATRAGRYRCIWHVAACLLVLAAAPVVGAAERLLLAVLHEEDIGNPLEIPALLTSLILDGIKA